MNNDIEIIDIFNLWLKWSKYDPNQKSFNLLSNSYDIHKATELAQKVLNEYDKTGLISVLMLKEEFIKCLKDESITCYDAIANRSKLEAELEMFEYFNSNIVLQAEKSLQYTLARLYKNIVGISLISDNTNLFKITYILSDIIEDIQKLNIDIYKTDGKPLKIEQYMQSIRVFNTLGEAVLTLENAPDGVYTCYINVLNSADSYFALFIKSGGTLISFNDRINEKYPGQHEVLSTRNGRWAENKRDTLFPYDCILEYSNYCPKGCAMSFVIKGESTKGNILFKDFHSERGFFGLVLGILLIKMKYDGHIFDGEITIIESLIGNRLSLVTAKNEIVPISGSEIVEYNKNLDLTFTYSELLHGIDGYQMSENSKQLVELYSKGFKPDYSLILDSNNTKLLSECNSDVSPYHVRPEYVGTANRIRCGAYYLIRKQLKQHIEQNILKEYKAFGGKEGCETWFLQKIKDNIDTVILKLAYEYLKAEEKVKALDKEPDSYWKEGVSVYSSDEDRLVLICHRSYPASGLWIRKKNIINTEIHNGKYKCLLSDNGCSVFFSTKFNSIEAVEQFLGKPVDAPRFLKLKSSGYIGNPLLDMVDPVSRIGSPLCDYFIAGGHNSNDKVELRFALGLSKRSLNQVLKMIGG